MASLKGLLMKKIAADVSNLPLYILEKLELMAKPYDASASFRFVGGCVRDTLLGRKLKDFDIVTNTTADTLEKMGLENVGKAFPVYLYHDDHYGQIEIAVARSEEKTGIGHKGFETVPTGNFEDDTIRRDLTINALMVDSLGHLTGPKNALEQIESKTFENISEKFAEDPLRVFRVARFAAQFGSDWNISLQLVGVMGQMQSELSSLPPDRVREEFRRAMAGKAPLRFFEVLKTAQCLAPWFVELDQNWSSASEVINYGAGQGWSFDEFLVGIGAAVNNPDSLLSRLGIADSLKKAIHFIKRNQDKLINPKHYDPYEITLLIQSCRGVLSLEQLLDCALLGKAPDSARYLLACQAAARATNMDGVKNREDATERLVTEIRKVSRFNK